MATPAKLRAFFEALKNYKTLSSFLLNNRGFLLNQIETRACLSEIIEQASELDGFEIKKMVRLIIEEIKRDHSDPSPFIAHSSNPISRACERGLSEVLALLLADLQNDARSVNEISALGKILSGNDSPLFHACTAGNPECIRLLIHAAQASHDLISSSSNAPKQLLKHMLSESTTRKGGALFRLILNGPRYFDKASLFKELIAGARACNDHGQTWQAMLENAELADIPLSFDESSDDALTNALLAKLPQEEITKATTFSMVESPVYKKTLSESIQNILLAIAIVGFNAIVIMPIVGMAGLVTSIALFLSKNIWIAVGVPIVYGIGNIIRKCRGDTWVKAPIGLAQWAFHAMILSSLIFFPLAFAGVGVLSGTWFASTAAPWLAHTAGPAIVTFWQSGFSATGAIHNSHLILSLLVIVLELGLMFKAWNNLETPQKRPLIKFTEAVRQCAQNSFDQTCPALKRPNPEITAELHDENIQIAAYQHNDLSKWFFDNSSSINVYTAYRDWHTSLGALSYGSTDTILATPSHNLRR